jgi:hypothetical protein
MYMFQYSCVYAADQHNLRIYMGATLWEITLMSSNSKNFKQSEEGTSA